MKHILFENEILTFKKLIAVAYLKKIAHAYVSDLIANLKNEEELYAPYL